MPKNETNNGLHNCLLGQKDSILLIKVCTCRVSNSAHATRDRTKRHCSRFKEQKAARALLVLSRVAKAVRMLICS